MKSDFEIASDKLAKELNISSSEAKLRLNFRHKIITVSYNSELQFNQSELNFFDNLLLKGIFKL